jgi:hypothetical protein
MAGVRRMKHKHSELIKAWADGAEIEYKSKVDGVWCPIEQDNWDEDYEYRVKPKQPFVRWLWAIKIDKWDGWDLLSRFMDDEQANRWALANKYLIQKLEYTRTEFPE